MAVKVKRRDTGEKPLISVIIPVYNVERYLEKCIISVLNQTYSNLEIILVIDGEMEDASEQVCMKFAEKDSRVRVKKIRHSGLAGVRNYGISCAKGEYISFIDSDDWAENSMIEDLYLALRREKAQMAVCGYYSDMKKKSRIRRMPGSGMVSKHKAFECLFADELPNYAWNKLYERSLFEYIRFPSGRLFEDIAIMHLIIDRTRRIAVVPKPEYHYVQRKGSILAGKNINVMLDALEMWIRQYRFMEQKYPELEKAFSQTVFRAFVSVASVSVFSSRTERAETKKRRRMMTKYFYSRRKGIEAGMNSLQRRILHLIWHGSRAADALALFMECIRRTMALGQTKLFMNDVVFAQSAYDGTGIQDNISLF